jgi:hypothetical protein
MSSLDLRTADLAKVKEEQEKENNVIAVPRENLVQKLQDAWQTTQKRSFTAWINFQIRSEGVVIGDISKDLSNGVNLATLLTVLSGELVKVNKNPKMRIHCIANVSDCLKLIESKGVKLVNISAEGNILFTNFGFYIYL